MAIYHLSVKVIGRASGRSAVAAAAYRSADRLHDERLDRYHAFTTKSGVMHREVLVPAGVCNGFQALADATQYLYCFDAEWVPGMSGVAVHPLDPALGIEVDAHAQGGKQPAARFLHQRPAALPHAVTLTL